jgi:hypothetical protein
MGEERAVRSGQGPGEEAMSEIHHLKHGALAVEGEFEKYALLFAGATRPGQHATVSVGLRVRNNSDTAIPFTFNTTQHFEIELVDPKGAVVSRWSEGKAFGQIVTTQSLEPHTTWQFHGELPVPQGGGLGSTEYTMRIYVMADLRPGAQGPLKVTVAP